MGAASSAARVVLDARPPELAELLQAELAADDGADGGEAPLYRSNLKVWRVSPVGENGREVSTTAVRPDEFDGFDPHECYIVLHTYRRGDDASAQSPSAGAAGGKPEREPAGTKRVPVPRLPSLADLSESSTQMLTPRGLASPFSKYDDYGLYPEDHQVDLVSAVLAKEGQLPPQPGGAPLPPASASAGVGGARRERHAHALYVWNGTEAAPLTRAVAVTHSFDLERFLLRRGQYARTIRALHRSGRSLSWAAGDGGVRGGAHAAGGGGGGRRGSEVIVAEQLFEAPQWPAPGGAAGVSLESLLFPKPTNHLLELLARARDSAAVAHTPFLKLLWQPAGAAAAAEGDGAAHGQGARFGHPWARADGAHAERAAVPPLTANGRSPGFVFGGGAGGAPGGAPAGGSAPPAAAAAAAAPRAMPALALGGIGARGGGEAPPTARGAPPAPGAMGGLDLGRLASARRQAGGGGGAGGGAGGADAAVAAGLTERELKEQQLSRFDGVCSEVTPQLFLGSDRVARDLKLLRSKGVTHVLNTASVACANYHEGRSELRYLTLPMSDSKGEDLLAYAYDGLEFLRAAIDGGGRALVHCHQGVSRSSSLVIAYLMWRNELPYEEVYTHVRGVRGVCNPNAGFMVQLMKWAKRLRDGVEPTRPRLYRLATHLRHPRRVKARRYGGSGRRGGGADDDDDDDDGDDDDDDDGGGMDAMLIGGGEHYDETYEGGGGRLVVIARCTDVYGAEPPKASALDTRAVFVLHASEALYVWHGARAPAEYAAHADAWVQRLQRYEHGSEHVHTARQGAEQPAALWAPFWEALGADPSSPPAVGANSLYDADYGVGGLRPGGVSEDGTPAHARGGPAARGPEPDGPRLALPAGGAAPMDADADADADAVRAALFDASTGEELSMFDSDDLLPDGVFILLGERGAEPPAVFVWVGAEAGMAEGAARAHGARFARERGLPPTARVSVQWQGEEDEAFESFLING